MRVTKWQRGLLKTIKQADDGCGFLSRTWVQVNYNKSTGEVWGDWMTGYERKVYDDPNIVSVCKFYGKWTRAEIAQAIEDQIADDAYFSATYGI